MGQVLSYFGQDFQTEPTKELKINNGPIRGVVYKFNDGKEGSGYMSIPYAKPPIGELRFKKPESPESWAEVRNCTKLPPRCPHQDMMHEKVTVNIPKSEDCLYLNVFTPGRVEDAKEKLPVMLYIHGGAFVVHSSSHLGDSNICKHLCSKDVIIVTINYRLGIFGFMTTSDSTCPGNFAFWDMHKALQWVQDNISFFGGDKNNVTIFGQSAGGAATDFLALSPYTRNLFKRYIAMAGTAYATHSRQTSKRLREEWVHYAEKVLGFKSRKDEEVVKVNEELLKFLRAQPASKMELSMMPDKRLTINPDGRLRVGPVVDGDFFPRDFLQLRKEVQNKDMIVGVTQWEGLLFMILKSSYTGFARDLMTGTLSKYRLDRPVEEYIDKAITEFIDPTKPENSPEHIKEAAKLISDIMYNNNCRHLAESSMRNGQKVYLYTFEYCRPNIGGLIGYLFPFKGATHTTELAYLFGKCITSTHFTPSPEDLVVLDRYTTYFTNFAKFGDPNGNNPKAEKKWPPLEEDHVERNLVIKEKEDIMEEEFFEGRYRKWKEIWPNIWEMELAND